MIRKFFIFSENWWNINTYPNDSFYLIVDLEKREKNPLKLIKKTTGHSISEWIFVAWRSDFRMFILSLSLQTLYKKTSM